MKSNSSNCSDQSGNDTFQSQLLPLFFLTSIFFLNFIIRIIISPLMPTILADMNLTQDQAGSFFLVSASGYCISLLCSGFVSSWLLHRKTIVFSAVATGLMFICMGFSHSLSAMRIGLFIVGMTAGVYLPSGIAMLTASINSKNWGKALGIHELAPNLGFLLAPMICEGLLLWISWRNVLMVVGSASILLGLCFYRFSTIKDFPGQVPMLKAFLPLAATPSFWVMMLLFSLGVTGTLGVYAMLPLFLVNEHCMPQSQANTLVTMSRILTLPMSFLTGWLADRFGLRRTMTFVLVLAGILTLFIGVLSGRLMQIVIFCQPVIAVCFFPPAFAALSHIGSKETRNVAISFTIPAAFLVGGGVVPNIIGILGEKGFFSMGFVVAGGLILSGAVLPFFLKFQDRD